MCPCTQSLIAPFAQLARLRRGLPTRRDHGPAAMPRGGRGRRGAAFRRFYSSSNCRRLSHHRRLRRLRRLRCRRIRLHRQLSLRLPLRRVRSCCRLHLAAAAAAAAATAAAAAAATTSAAAAAASTSRRLCQLADAPPPPAPTPHQPTPGPPPPLPSPPPPQPTQPSPSHPPPPAAVCGDNHLKNLIPYVRNYYSVCTE